MCTLSWHSQGTSLRVWFNRDEQRSRPLAEPPRRATAGNLSYLAPRDTAAGGTWIAANEVGLVGALLNRYSSSNDASTGRRSRGTILPQLMAGHSLAEARDLLGGMTCADFAPFILWLAQGTEALQLDWDGQRLTESTPAVPITTSSVRSVEIPAFRAGLWHDADLARSFPDFASRHLFRDPDDPARGPLMDREDARTVSLTMLEVGADTLRMRYLPRDPNGIGFTSPQDSELARSTSLTCEQ